MPLTNQLTGFYMSAAKGFNGLKQIKGVLVEIFIVL